MNINALDGRTDNQLGKRILDDLYIHTNYLNRILEDSSYHELIQAALAAMKEEDLKLCNVAKINVHRNRRGCSGYDPCREPRHGSLDCSAPA